MRDKINSKDKENKKLEEVKVYNIIPEEVRSLLEPLDLEAENDLQGDHTE